jgi:alkyl hydroperoxide reductase subunit AhpF
MIIEHVNKIHQAACIAAEGLQQQEISAAILAGGGSATVAAAVRTAQIKFYNTVIASCIANGQSSSNFHQALRDLRAI